MRCGACEHENSASARFCEQCGTPLGAPATPDPLARPPEPLAEKILSGRPALEGERKQITVMFSDIVGSMELAGSLDTERWRSVLERFFAISCRAVHGVEGTVHQFTGDGVMALFGAPLAHEDHARRGCLAALELQKLLEPFAEEVAREHGLDFQVRCGLNSGEVVVGSIGDDLQMDYASIGNTNGLAKRMESLAPAGSTALSASTVSLVEGEFDVRELGEFDVKGVKDPQPVFELVGRDAARTRFEAAEARGLSRFVGRSAEAAVLEDALDRALAGDGRVVCVVGEPGVGKSRLARELERTCEERGVRVNRASAVAHGRAVPLLPVLAMLRDFFGIGDETEPGDARRLIEETLTALGAEFEADLPVLFDFLGIPDPERPQEQIDPEARQRRLLAFIGRLVAARSRVEAAVIVIEDLHWLDEASGAFLEELVRAVGSTRTLLVMTFRPEYEAGWAGDVPYRELALSPLDPEASGELLAELLGDHPSLDGLAELIQRRTAGNPFFIEEAVQALAETGHLSGERGAYEMAGPLEQLVLPPTVQAVLAARIDRLASREKALVQTMSVIGREIPEPVLRKVSDLGEAELADAVGTLTAADFLNPARVNGHREYAFKHPLTQEVAYASQLSEPRALAHAAVAAAIEQVYADGLEERAALLAHHTEAAGEKLAAARWHARAAAWVAASSPADGMRHWRRVRELANEFEPSEEVDQLAVLARVSILALAWRLGMPHEEIAEIHAEGQALTGGTEVKETPTTANEHKEDREEITERVLLNLGKGMALFLGGSEVDGRQALRPAEREARDLGDVGMSLAVGWAVGLASYFVGSLDEGFEATDRALRSAGDEVTAGSDMGLGFPYANCLWVRAACRGFGGDVPGALSDYERAIDLAAEYGDLETEGYARGSRSGLRCVVGSPEDALADAERAVEIAEGREAPVSIASAYGFLAGARLTSGDFGGARTAAEKALATVRELSLGLNIESWVLAKLADARLGLGDLENGLAAAEEAVAIARGRSLGVVSAQLALARALRHTGGISAEVAIEAALSDALDKAAETGFRAFEPDIHAELAALARLRGDDEAAGREAAEAERILAEIKAPPTGPASEAEVEGLVLDLLQAAGLLFGGKEVEGAGALRSGYRRLLELERPDLVLEASSAAAYACWVAGDPGDGIEFVDLALEQASDEVLAGPGLAVKSPHAQALWVRALCAGAIGRFHVGQRDLDRSLELAQEHGDAECEGFTHECRSRLLSDVDNVEEAGVHAVQAVETAEQAENPQALASALANLAAIRNRSGDYAEAREAATRGLEVLSERGAGMLWEPDLLAALGIAEAGLGETDQGRADAEYAVAVARERSLRRSEIVAQVALAGVLLDADGTEQAEAAEAGLHRALELAGETGFRATELSIHRGLAALARARGDEDAAEHEETAAERVLAVIKGSTDGSAKDAERVLLDTTYATNVFFGAREAEGFELLREAAGQALELGDAGLALPVAAPAAFAAWELGRPRHGLEIAHSALALAGEDTAAGAGQTAGCPYAQTLWVSALCSGHLGDLQRAEREFRRSVDLSHEYRDLETETFAVCSRAYLKRDLMDLESAKSDAVRSTELAENASNPIGLIAAYGPLALIRADLGEFADAAANAERALALARERRVHLVWEPGLLAALALAKLGLGDLEGARVAADEALVVAEERSLPRGEILAELALARVLAEADGPEESEAIKSALCRALEVASSSEFRATIPRIHMELAALARLRGEEREEKREEAEAEQILAEMKAPT